VDLAALARYPFLPEAAARVAQDGPSLEELLSERVWGEARRLGRARLLAAIDEAELPVPRLPSREGSLEDLRALQEDLLSYVYARILVSAMADPYVVRRHALAEALRARAFLLQEEDPAILARAAEALGLAFEPDGRALRAHFTEYLRFAVHLKDVEWKLVSQPLQRGFVAMDAATASRLVQEALRRRIESELPRELSDEVQKAVEADLAPLKEATRVRKEKFNAEAGFGPVDLKLMPPCMQHILGQLHAGENVAHSGRFAITSFLHTIGMKSEEIMALFAQAPDFREDLTRYQVEHITGVTSGTTYSPPSCQAMQTFGICYNADDTCKSRKKDGSPRVTHPLSYYRFKVWLRDRDQARAAPPPQYGSQAAGSQ